MRLPLLIALAGALGTLSRYYVSGWATRHFGPHFPFGTLAVNLVGCFVLAVVMTSAMHATGFNKELRQAVTIGFFGAFTTFSTFGFEGVKLIENGHVGSAVLYVGLSVSVGLLAAWGGVMCGKGLAA